MNHTWNIIDIKTNKLVDSLFIGNYKTHFKSKWIEFADYREYIPWDSIKSIDWVRSDLEWKTMVKLYEEERELSVYFLLDGHENIFFEHDGVNKLPMYEEFVRLLWYSAVKSWDKVWWLMFDDSRVEFTFAKKWKPSLFNILSQFEKFLQNKSFFDIFKKSQPIEYFNSLKINKSLIFLLSSRLDFDEKQLKILSLKHDFVFVNIFHSFENTLQGKWIYSLWNNDSHLTIDVDSTKKIDNFRQMRKKAISDLKQKIARYGGQYLYIDEKTKIYEKLLEFMNNRS